MRKNISITEETNVLIKKESGIEGMKDSHLLVKALKFYLGHKYNNKLEIEEFGNFRFCKTVTN